MDFGLSEEQRLLQASLNRWLDDEVPVARMREVVEAKQRDVRPIWRGLAELGVPGILVPAFRCQARAGEGAWRAGRR